MKAVNRKAIVRQDMPAYNLKAGETVTVLQLDAKTNRILVQASDRSTYPMDLSRVVMEEIR